MRIKIFLISFTIKRNKRGEHLFYSLYHVTYPKYSHYAGNRIKVNPSDTREREKQLMWPIRSNDNNKAAVGLTYKSTGKARQQLNPC